MAALLFSTDVLLRDCNTVNRRARKAVRRYESWQAKRVQRTVQRYFVN